MTSAFIEKLLAPLPATEHRALEAETRKELYPQWRERWFLANAAICQRDAQLWARLQSLAAYRDKTLLLVTTDHGRGATRHEWINHGEKVEDAEYIWLAALGPDVPPRGVRCFRAHA